MLSASLPERLWGYPLPVRFDDCRLPPWWERPPLKGFCQTESCFVAATCLLQDDFAGRHPVTVENL